jgi:hypothetical protein
MIWWRGKRSYLAEGRADFPRALELSLSDWNNGNYPTDVTGKYGVCPNCKKHQHWSKDIIDLPPKGRSKAGIIIKAFFGSLFGTGLISIIHASNKNIYFM